MVRGYLKKVPKEKELGILPIKVSQILERARQRRNETDDIMKTVVNGKLTIHNVPHTPFTDGIGADGEDMFIRSNVMYTMAHIFQYMIRNNIRECDYEETKELGLYDEEKS